MHKQLHKGSSMFASTSFWKIHVCFNLVLKNSCLLQHRSEKLMFASTSFWKIDVCFNLVLPTLVTTLVPSRIGPCPSFRQYRWRREVKLNAWATSGHLYNFALALYQHLNEDTKCPISNKYHNYKKGNWFPSYKKKVRT